MGLKIKKNYADGDCSKPIDNYFKKGFLKRYNRKKFYRKLKKLTKTEK